MVKILAVDDSKSMRQMVSQTLTEAGFETKLARDGVEALEVAREYIADVVITDVNMPNMDGITLVKRLRELPEYRYFSNVAVTTESSTEKKMEGKNAGASGWIVKPFDPDRLVATVKRVLD